MTPDDRRCLAADLCTCRRTFLGLAGAALVAAPTAHARSPAAADGQRFFVAEAIRLRDEAVARGDQPYGAVLVIGGTIAGYGSSRVVSDRNPDAHAERVALWDAQKRLGRRLLEGAAIYATSRPCAACQQALAEADVERMLVGPAAEDAGRPRSNR
jgi:tRNA(Arg) A34 adenosine deaminase TadA